MKRQGFDEAAVVSCVVHFIFTLTGIVLLFVALYSMGSATASGEPMDRAVHHWHVLAFLGGVCCFVLGCATLACELRIGWYSAIALSITDQSN
jgi:uncharacterized membrane protein